MLVLAGMELDTVRHLLVGKVRNALARFGIPHAAELVVATADKARAVVVEADIAHSLLRAEVCPHDAPLAVDFPQLDLAVHARREEQMRRVGNKADGCHAFGVARPVGRGGRGGEASRQSGVSHARGREYVLREAVCGWVYVYVCECWGRGVGGNEAMGERPIH